MHADHSVLVLLEIDHLWSSTTSKISVLKRHITSIWSSGLVFSND